MVYNDGSKSGMQVRRHESSLCNIVDQYDFQVKTKKIKKYNINITKADQ